MKQSLHIRRCRNSVVQKGFKASWETATIRPRWVAVAFSVDKYET